MRRLPRTAAVTALLGAVTAAVLALPASGSAEPSTSATALSPAQQADAATAYSEHVTSEQQRRVDRLLEHLDPRLQGDATYVVKALEVQATAATYWDVEPGSPFRVEVSPSVSALSDVGLLRVLTHESAHVQQFETYRVNGSWLGHRRLDRLSDDLAAIHGSSADRGVHPIETSADCMTAEVLGDDILRTSAYVDECSPADRAAAQRILDGERLSDWGW